MSSSMTEAEFTAECEARGFTVLIPGKHDVQVHGFVDIGDGIRVSRWNGGPDFASVLKYLVAVRKRQDEVLAVKAKIKGEKAPKAKAAEPEPVVEKPKPAAAPPAKVEKVEKPNALATGLLDMVKTVKTKRAVLDIAKAADKWLAEGMLTTSQWEAITDAVNARAALMEPEAGPKAKPKAALKAKAAVAKPAPKPAAKPKPKAKAKVAGPGVKKGGGR